MTKQSKNTPAAPQSNDVQAAYIFSEALKAHSDDDAKAFALKLGASFDERVQHEISSHINGTADLPIVKKLNKYRARLALPSIAKVFMETSTTPAFVNTTRQKEAGGKRFNIYAVEKMIDIVEALSGAKKVTNAHNLAIGKSMINFEEAGASFTGEMALCASSKEIRSQDPNVKLLNRYIVAKQTAGTQSSSTLNAMQALGLIINKGTKRAASWVFADTDQARAYKELLKTA